MKTSTRTAIAMLALATTATPMIAQAQDRNHDRRDRGERHERYDRQDRHDRNDRHDRDRRDYRGPQREWRSDYRPAPHHVRPRHDDRRYAAPPRWNRNDRNWWRDHRDFRDYRGSRAGYWYAPGYGYYNVESRYRDYRWREGSYLPASYRSYYVREPDFYGLRPAPRGYRYVHAGNDIVLMALATGLITSVLSGVY